MKVLPGLRVLTALALSLTVILSSLPVAARQKASRLEDALPSVVRIAAQVVADDDGNTESLYVPLGSGSIVSPTGLILTNAHVVDMDAVQAELDRSVGTQTEAGISTVTLDTKTLLVLGSTEPTPAKPLYLAEVVAQDEDLDLAVLRIVSNADGSPLDPDHRSFASIPLADSDAVHLGDAIDILSFPGIGGDAVTYTAGVVSGFRFGEVGETRDWINTDAMLSGGSSGGAALNEHGELIGVPTQGSALDCRPGDTNLDGEITSDDLGCVPVGGSIGQLRPINQALALLTSAGYSPSERLQESGYGSAYQSEENGGYGYLDPDELVDASSNQSSGWTTLDIIAPYPPITPSGPGWSPEALVFEPSTVNDIAAAAVSGEEVKLEISVPDPSSCANGPVYPKGTLLYTGQHLVTGVLLDPSTNAQFYVPPGTILRTTSHFVEAGKCDQWPVEIVRVPLLPDRIRATGGPTKGVWDMSPEQLVTTGMTGLIDERWVILAP